MIITLESIVAIRPPKAATRSLKSGKSAFTCMTQGLLTDGPTFITDGETEEAWERMHGSGAAGTSQADSLRGSAQGRQRLAEMREALKRAQQRKAQVVFYPSESTQAVK